MGGKGSGRPERDARRERRDAASSEQAKAKSKSESEQSESESDDNDSDYNNPPSSPSYHGHPVLSSRHVKYRLRPDRDLPEGWMYHDIPRLADNKKKGCHSDRYWYSPGKKLRFKSKSELNRFLACLEEVDGDESEAIDDMGSSTKKSPNKSSSSNKAQKSSTSVINVGDIGYTFRKQFDDGWYIGTVVKFRPGAKGRKDRRCHYNDGDSEDLSLTELQRLALLDPEVTKKEPSSSTKSEASQPAFNENGDAPSSQDHSVDDKSEAAKVTGDADLRMDQTKSPEEETAEAAGKWEERDGVRFRKSSRSVKAPRKIDEIYSYEHVKLSYAKKARFEQSSPEMNVELLSSLDHIIPFDKAAESTLHCGDPVENSGEVRAEKNKDDNEEEDDGKQWLEKVAASLGADTSAMREKRLPRPFYRSTSSLDGPTIRSSTNNGGPAPHTNAMKSDAASVCSTITCISDNKPSGKCDGDSLKRPPVAVLVAHPPSAPAERMNNGPLSLLSEKAKGTRHGCLVYHKNDSRRRVAEVILECDSSWVEVAIDGLLKKYRINHLYVVPPHFKVGDSVPSNYGRASTRTGQTKKPRTKPPLLLPDKKLPALSIDTLFSWICDKCDAGNKMADFVCHSCNAAKTAKSKRSILLQIAENAVEGNVKTVEEAMGRIPYSDRTSIPKMVLEHLLDTKTSGESVAKSCTEPSSDVDLASLKLGWEGFYYWMCGSCTMQNSFRRTTCSACLQGKAGLAERSPLLKIAENAAIKSKTTDEALSLVPEKERLLIPKFIMDALVTCVFIIEGRNGQRRRCLKQKIEGVDYCVSHCDPLLLNKARADTQEGSIDPPSCNGADSPSHTSQVVKDVPRRKGIAAINGVMPGILRDINKTQVNELNLIITSIEDSVLCGENTAFPLGMKVRKFFEGYGFHDGRIIKVARKNWVDSDKKVQRPILVYRLKYNDGDQEDFLHHEIASLREIYDRSHVSPEAPTDIQLSPGELFETRFGTIKIVGHKTPPGSIDPQEGGIVIVNFQDSSKEAEFELLKLQLLVLRKIRGSSSKSNVAALDCEEGDIPTDSPRKQIAFPSPPSNFHGRSMKAAVLEWPGRAPNQNDDESIEADDQRHGICEGLSLHRKRCDRSPDDDVAKFPTTSALNNPCDVRPGCKSGMWDPAACFDYLSWDPYGSTVCEICAVDKDDNQVVICDECHSGFHTYCLRPVMVNIPKDDWVCSACIGRSNVQLSFEEYSENMCGQHQDILNYLGLSWYKNPSDFFTVHSEAISLYSLHSQGAVKQRAISQQVKAKSVTFDVGGIKFVRAPVKHDWILPTPLLKEEDYTPSILSMVAAMKYCGMESYIVDLNYTEDVKEEMNDPTLEAEEITPMSKRNVEIFRAFQYNMRRGAFPPVQVIHDENFGFSVKALAPMRRHTIIGEYLGEVVTMEQSGSSNSDSLMVLLDTGEPTTSLIIDPTRVGNIARFLSGINNRSLMSKRKANVRTRRFFMDDGKVHVCLFTSRRVEAGEILNYDYNAGLGGKDLVQWTRSGFYDTSNFF